jgi:hypothetical protein
VEFTRKHLGVESSANNSRQVGVVLKAWLDMAVLVGQGNPQLNRVHGLPDRIGLQAKLRVRNAATRGHEVELTGN